MFPTRLAAWLIILVVSIFTLKIAMDLLIPLVLAISILYIINTLAEVFRKYLYSGKGSHLISQIAAAVLILSLLFLAVVIIVGSVKGMVDRAPSYQSNFRELVDKVTSISNLDQVPSVTAIVKNLDFGTIAKEIWLGISGFVGSLLLVIIYLVFLLIEQQLFPRKFRALFAKKEQFDRAGKTLDRIHHSIRSYIGIKTLTSLMTGFISWIVMAAVGLDFAVFWAFLIFILNFIPVIGSLVATIFPSLFAIVQFEGYSQFAIVLFGLSAAQLVIDNFLEPKLMGTTLNISGLVVLLSLAAWGSIWGITGMLLSAPITVSAIIVLAEFPKSRPIAILLSANGKVGAANDKSEQTD